MDIKSRIDWVDVAKGIGIVLVVYGHVLVGLTASSMNMHGDYFLCLMGLYGPSICTFFSFWQVYLQVRVFSKRPAAIYTK